jgi:hypothetical protein
MSEPQRRDEAHIEAVIEAIIRELGLVPLPEEGGLYAETYRSDGIIPGGAIPGRHENPRRCATAIYYLITPERFSALHRVTSTEVFHFYLGDPVDLVGLGPAPDQGRVVRLGQGLLAGECPQAVVPAGLWQGSCLAPGGRWALLGTTMAPGFDFADYEQGAREPLLEQFPSFAGWIRDLTVRL